MSRDVLRDGVIEVEAFYYYSCFCCCGGSGLATQSRSTDNGSYSTLNLAPMGVAVRLILLIGNVSAILTGVVSTALQAVVEF